MQTAHSLPLFCFLLASSRHERRRGWGTTLTGYLVNSFAISLQGHWAKHLVKWPTPFQSQNLQEPWQHQKTRRRRRRRPWRPCSPGWPHSAARGRPAGPSRSFPARLPGAGTLLWSGHHFMCLLHYTSERALRSEKVLCSYLSIFAEVLGSQRVCPWEAGL